MFSYLTHGVDVDVVLGFLGVRNEGLDKELAEHTDDGLNLLFLCSTSLNPIPSLSPSLVQSEQTALASPLDQLVGLGHELRSGGQQPRVCNLCLVENILHRKVVGEVQRSESGGRVVGGRRRERSRLNDGGASEVVVEDGLAIGFEDRFGGHCVYVDGCTRIRGVEKED